MVHLVFSVLRQKPPSLVLKSSSSWRPLVWRDGSSSSSSSSGGGQKGVQLAPTTTTTTTTPTARSPPAESHSSISISGPGGPSPSPSSAPPPPLELEGEGEFVKGDVHRYFDFSQSFNRSEAWRSKLVNSMLVYPNFITKEEESCILQEIEPYLSRLHYENSHWDDAIHEYRETERSKWNKRNEGIINRIREVAFPPQVPQLKLVHILDLAKNGMIKPHIDSIRFCGNTIAGLSLLSNCVMRLRHDVQKDFYCDIYLPHLSLYVMRNFSRFEFTHEILSEAESKFQNRNVPRGRRISIICRNEPTTSTGPVFTPLEM